MFVCLFVVSHFPTNYYSQIIYLYSFVLLNGKGVFLKTYFISKVSVFIDVFMSTSISMCVIKVYMFELVIYQLFPLRLVMFSSVLRVER